MTRPDGIQGGGQRTAAWPEDGSSSPGDLFARLRRIEEAHATPRDRAAAVLEVLREGLGALAGTITLSALGEELELQTEGGPEGASSWMPVLRSAALEARSHGHTIARVFGSKTTAPEFVVIAAPFDDSDRDPFGAAAVLCRCRDASQAERLKLHLRSASIVASSILRRARRRRAGVGMDDFARVFSKAGVYGSVEEFAYAMTNAAKLRFNCEQAALGIVRGHKLRMACVSGLDHVKRRSPGVHQIEQAMGECADACEPIVEQARDRWESGFAAEGRLHKRWRAACGGDSVASVPVFAGEALVAVLSLRRPSDEPFDADELAAVCKLLSPLGSAIPLIARSTRSLASHAASSTRESVRWLLRPASITKKVLVAGTIACAAWYAFVPSMYRVTAPGTVVAAREHVVASPIDARVSKVLVRAGDRVVEGQPLVRMESSRLLMEESALRSEIERAEIRIKEAIANEDPAGASVASAERKVHLARLRDVRERIGGATIEAPRAGVVTGTSISNLEGRVVAEGEPFFAIADETSLAIEVLLPQHRVTDLAQGAPLRFASHARPESPGASSLARISPTGVERGGRTVFVARADLPESQGWLRPGMEGVAIIDAGMHPNWWIALHRGIDAARLNFWIE